MDIFGIICLHISMHSCSVTQLCPTLCNSMDWSWQPTRLLYPWNFPGKNTGVGCHALLQGLFPIQGLNPGLSHCRWILYQLSHEGKPKNTGVGKLSLLQRIFLTQEVNWDLLNCRWILYQLSYQGSPDIYHIIC